MRKKKGIGSNLGLERGGRDTVGRFGGVGGYREGRLGRSGGGGGYREGYSR